ncbi:sulfite exporter TauE/SafE family protein [Phaeodactylibacter xiamenensis]|uniref:sulfite exporter TauE/SafE family protein n=1 Tax=Phaeodactylibacter xiamenensis TaxID=1524460 RepID=UPI0024A80009|nr:sulfite exporter TauE/SafE family protein [Phaeodactylibacter xiamenensis]
MELSLEYWYLLPVAALVATIAMSTGLGGAVFFSPLFILALRLDPKVAIGAALITELFGFSSGLIAYYRSKLIDFSLAWSLLLFSVPAAMLGTFYADAIPDIVLKAIFAVGLTIIGFQLFNAWRAEERAKKELEHRKEFEGNYESELTDATGRVHHYTVCNKPMGKAFAAIGGAFVGMISVGLAELQEYHLVARCKVPTPVAVGTSIFVVVITVLVASAGHFYEFAKVGGTVLSQVLSVVIFTVPGVVLGGQIGPRLQKSLPEDKMKVGIAVLFMLLGAFMLFTLTL